LRGNRSNPNSDSYTNCDGDRRSHSYPYGHCIIYRDSNINAHSRPNRDSYGYTHSQSNTDWNTDNDGNAE
jgi:hypothetical protein